MPRTTTEEDAALRDFLARKHQDWELTQTVAPTGIAISEITDRSLLVSWTPIAFDFFDGGYEVTATPDLVGPLAVATTASKQHDSIIVRGLAPSTQYSVMVRTTTHPHGAQQNFLRSDPAAAVTATTKEKELHPAEVVVNVYGLDSGVGTVHIRTSDWDKLQASASLVDVSGPEGHEGTSLPIFRSDRAIGAGERLILAGLPSDSAADILFYIQETSGGAVEARIDFLDRQGREAGNAVNVPLGAFELRELSNIVPATAATAVVSVLPGSTGRVVGYGLVSDPRSRDRWPLVDWSRFFGLTASTALRVPVVMSGGEGEVRRRLVRRPTGGGSSMAASATALRTSLTIFNGDDARGRARLAYFESGGSLFEREITVEAKETITVEDVVQFMRGRSGRSLGYLVLTPLGGSLVVTSRIDSSGRGFTVPVVGATAGVRLGQALRFAALEDSARATVDAGKPGTFRTGFGISETTGKPVKVRAEIVLSEAGALAAARIARDYSVGANETIFIEDMARSILGEARETRFGDLRNLQLTLQLIEGEGAATFFVHSADNGSGDSILRME